MVAAVFKKYALIFWFLGCLLMDYLTSSVQSYVTYVGVIGHIVLMFALLINDIDTLELGLYTYVFTLYCNIVGDIVYSVFIGDYLQSTWIAVTGGYLLITGLMSMYLTLKYIQDQKALLYNELNRKTKLNNSYNPRNSIFSSHSDIARHWQTENDRFIIDQPRFPELKVEELPFFYSASL